MDVWITFFTFVGSGFVDRVTERRHLLEQIILLHSYRHTVY